MIPLLEKWRQLRQSFTHTPQAVRFVWRTNRWATVGLGLLTLGGALLPASQAWVGKLIVDGVVASIQSAQDPEQVRNIE
jgi:ATP-binding cassette, subfamily B, bacterial